MTGLRLYRKYHLDRDNTLAGLFRLLKAEFGECQTVYPGSFAHITPSLFFRDALYIDSAKGFAKVANDPKLTDYIAEHKYYEAPARVRFLHQDYFAPLPAPETFDLAISLYAGFVGQAAKPLLRPGGLLVANDSHADAGLAFLDAAYAFRGAVSRISDAEYALNAADLGGFFQPKKPDAFTPEALRATMKGPAYKKTADLYLFEKR